MPQNSLTCYSVGLGVFRREYMLASGQASSLRIPIKKQYRGDLIASLRLFGPVRVLEPVSWPQDTASPLTIDPKNANTSLLLALSGRAVTFTPKGGKSISGINLGLQLFNEPTSGDQLQRYYVLVQDTSGKINRYALDEVQDLTFTEVEVQAEVARSLMQNAIRIKPESTYATISVLPEADGAEPTVVVQYATPFPAWQPTYRLEKGEEGFTLEGMAKIDYDGEEDLTDCQVTLVVGEPDTFETDLADMKIPARNRVNLVKARAAGGYIPTQDSMDDFEMAEGGDLSLELGAPMSNLRAAMAPLPPAPAAMPARMHAARRVETIEAKPAEVGDYSVWTTPYNLTLRSRQSALIPLFHTPVREAERLLYYKHEVHETRPKLAIWFTNTLEQSLGMGVCTVFEEGTLTGECVLNAVKPNERTLLLYGTEGGVRVLRHLSSVEETYRALTLSQGSFRLEVSKRVRSDYRFQNFKPETYTVLVEHDRQLSESELQVSDGGKVCETLQNGVRISLKLGANGKASLSTVETKTELTVDTFTMNNWSYWWNIWLERLPLNKRHPALDSIRAAQASLDRVNKEIEINTQKSQKAQKTSDRLLNYLNNPRSGSQQQMEKWQSELAECHEEIKRGDARATELEKEKTERTDALIQAIKDASLTWKKES